MITSAYIKEQARKFGADLVGITSMDRFEGAPKQMDPRYIFPGAKSMIVLGYRIPRGAFRGIEEGTFFHYLSIYGICRNKSYLRTNGTLESDQIA